MSSVGLTLGLALLLLPLAWRDPARRGYALLFVAVLALYLLLPAVAGPLGPPRPLPGGGWSAAPWLRQLLSLALLAAIALWLTRTLGFSRAELGLTGAQQPGAWRVGLAVTVSTLAIHFFVLKLLPGQPPPAPLEVWLYQATLPGLVEELAFRGVLLALADRATPPAWRGFGAPLGWGAAVVTLVFWTLHGPSLASALAILPPALLYLWLRARSGSLLLPVLAHNLWNLLILAAAL
jgi:membrane protease YdiL (CAAX protease family)